MNRITKISGLLIVLASLAAAVVAQPKPPVQSQEVKFDGHTVKLTGTLLLPKLDSGKRAPAVLIVPDSGVTSRDGITIGETKHSVYRDLAEHLASKGIVVLRYDKRCAGTSECKAAETFDDFIDDARKAAEFLKAQSQVDPAKVFLFGHGEGGYISSSLGAAEDSKFAGVILAASPGRHLHKIIRKTVERRLNEENKKPEDREAILAKLDRIVRLLQNGQQDFSGIPLNEKDYYDAVLADMIKQRHVIVSLFINDPLQIVNNIQSPTLILQGKKDIQVTVQDAEFLEEAMKRASHKDSTLQLFDDVDHLLKTNKGAASSASLSDVSRPVDEALLAAMTDWILKKAK
jgi:alpha-beta hydrolase superfamily lysophospholipase